MTSEKNSKHIISKILSPNDTGKTGAHQAGILVPKKIEILSFFPTLNIETKNPRRELIFVDKQYKQWKFSFIYYNNRFFGGTRNEFRLTCMTPFLKLNGLLPGDELLLEKSLNGTFSIDYVRTSEAPEKLKKTLVLGNQWKIIKI